MTSVGYTCAMRCVNLLRLPLLFAAFLLVSGCAVREAPSLSVSEKARLAEKYPANPESQIKISKDDYTSPAASVPTAAPASESFPRLQPSKQEKIVKKPSKAIKKPNVVKKKKAVSLLEKKVIGTVATIYLQPENKKIMARVDTGAKICSLDAKDMIEFERDGKRWVRFVLFGQRVEKPVVRHIRIKGEQDRNYRRPVIKLRFTLQDISRSVEVSLTNRANYRYPMLVGRNFLVNEFLVGDIPKGKDATVLGVVEEVEWSDQNLTLDARIDTGAKKSSINAQNISYFLKDGKEWVRFTVNKKQVERPVIRKVWIKGEGMSRIRRPIVTITLKIGATVKEVKVTLADRSNYTYALLIGRNFLGEDFMVDVSKQKSVKIFGKPQP